MTVFDSASLHGGAGRFRVINRSKRQRRNLNRSRRGTDEGGGGPMGSVGKEGGSDGGARM